MRPNRRYLFVFRHPTHPDAIVFPQIGPTPCAARNKAFEMLEALKKADPTYPQDNRWKMESQTDQGLV